MCKVVNKYKESYDVYIGRGSVWGNPYSHIENTKAKYKVDSRDDAVDSYKYHLWDMIKRGEITTEMLVKLDGKRLGCFCKPKKCHGDIIVKAVKWALKESNK